MVASVSHLSSCSHVVIQGAPDCREVTLWGVPEPHSKCPEAWGPPSGPQKLTWGPGPVSTAEGAGLERGAEIEGPSWCSRTICSQPQRVPNGLFVLVCRSV